MEPTFGYAGGTTFLIGRPKQFSGPEQLKNIPKLRHLSPLAAEYFGHRSLHAITGNAKKLPELLRVRQNGLIRQLRPTVVRR